MVRGREAGPQVRRLDIGDGARVAAPAPAPGHPAGSSPASALKASSERAEGLLPARRRDVEAPAWSPGRNARRGHARESPPPRSGRAPRPPRRSGRARAPPRPSSRRHPDDRADLRVGRSVVGCPGDHARGVLVLERQRVGHRGHLMGIIPPKDLHALAQSCPARVPRPEEVRRPPPGPSLVPRARNLMCIGFASGLPTGASAASARSMATRWDDDPPSTTSGSCTALTVRACRRTTSKPICGSTSPPPDHPARIVNGRLVRGTSLQLELMTPADLSEAQRRAREWHAAHTVP